MVYRKCGFICEHVRHTVWLNIACGRAVRLDTEEIRARYLLSNARTRESAVDYGGEGIIPTNAGGPEETGGLARFARQ